MNDSCHGAQFVLKERNCTPIRQSTAEDFVGEFSVTHLLLLAIIVLIFFGPSRLPALGQSLGKAIKGFKQGLHEIDAEVKPVVEQANEKITHQPVAQPMAQLKAGPEVGQQATQQVFTPSTEKETQKI